MLIVKFIADTEVNDRLYLAGQSHEFEDDTARQLIDQGSASLPTVLAEKPVVEEPEKVSAPKSSKTTRPRPARTATSDKKLTAKKTGE